MSVKVTKRSEDYARWYTDVVQKAELADYGPVKGMMVIRPYGYALWENIRNVLDEMFRETGHSNAYFPLLIPESFMRKEEEHIEGFAPECAVVTHGGGKKLEEPLYVRPTSETIIWAMYKKWIKSYRDLPILINQWANIIRWEMRTRLFLRTTEFLWQEGHTAHASFEEAERETRQMIEIYKTLAEDYLAIPVYMGKKTESEKFAGAVHTYSIEAMMGDKKALQAGTSHNLGQNFARAFGVYFQNQKNQQELVYATSWGVSTRLIGALIMAHGDDKGLMLPPKIAPYQVVIVPIWRNDQDKTTVLESIEKITGQLKSKSIRYHVDSRETVTPGFKFNDWEMRGVPLRLEIGPRDIKNESCMAFRRDGEKKFQVPMDGLVEFIQSILDEIQDSMFKRALAFRDENTHEIRSYDELAEVIEKGGFAVGYWAGTAEHEQEIQDKLKASIRCIPFEDQSEGICFYTGKKAPHRVVFAKAY